ncbi:hypothetical protein AMTRI_Chr09g33730 [Amborella trichopoda]
MAALISFPSSDTAHLSLTLSSAFLFSAATAFVFVMSKVQPSHLAEERRPTLQEHPLHSQPTNALLSAQSSLDSLRTIHRAPALPGMLETFPSEVKPAAWWPKRGTTRSTKTKEKVTDNGWSAKMAAVTRVLRERDMAEYVRLSKLLLNCNREMAVAGPILMAAVKVGSALGGSATVGGVVAGALARVVNSFSHGGQVGMYRNNAGFYQLLEESLEGARRVSSLRNLASSLSSSKDQKEFGSKLF